MSVRCEKGPKAAFVKDGNAQRFFSARNGNKSLDEIVDHMASDSLVGWGWNPGEGREPVPGTQQAFGELIESWAETGAACPAI